MYAFPETNKTNKPVLFDRDINLPDAGNIERYHLSLPGRALTGGLVVFARTGRRSRSPCPACADGVRCPASLSRVIGEAVSQVFRSSRMVDPGDR